MLYFVIFFLHHFVCIFLFKCDTHLFIYIPLLLLLAISSEDLCSLSLYNVYMMFNRMRVHKMVQPMFRFTHTNNTTSGCRQNHTTTLKVSAYECLLPLLISLSFRFQSMFAMLARFNQFIFVGKKIVFKFEIPTMDFVFKICRFICDRCLSKSTFDFEMCIIISFHTKSN